MSDNYKRQFTVSLDKDLHSSLVQFLEANSFPNQPEACRFILRSFFAATPEAGAVNAKALQAYNEIRTWSMTRTAQAHASIADELKEALKQETPK